VPLREARDFVGGLEGLRASKGVFVTTSYFPSTAYEFIARVSKRVVLIYGPELADLMIRHRVGVRVKDTYEAGESGEEIMRRLRLRGIRRPRRRPCASSAWNLLS